MAPKAKISEIAGDDSPAQGQLAHLGNALATRNTAALVPATSGQSALAESLAEIQLFLSKPFVSARAIAAASESAAIGKDDLFLFTLLKFGEAEFEDDNGELQPAYLWLSRAQCDLTYIKNNGDLVEIAAGDDFIVSQKPNRLRTKIKDQVLPILANEGAIPNVTMVFVPLSAKAAAKGWSRAVTFSVVDPSLVPA